MHEGMFSLMQMAKTSGALSRHAAARLPFISIMTDPTMGGVTASFATLGDLNLAEPKAMIGFAGARVLKETTRQDLPKGFQTAEFLLERGLVDRIVSRLEMRAELSKNPRLPRPTHRPQGPRFPPQAREARRAALERSLACAGGVSRAELWTSCTLPSRST